MYLQIGKDKIDISEITIHYIQGGQPIPWELNVSHIYSKSDIAPKHITDEIFDDTEYEELCSYKIRQTPRSIFYKKWDIMEYFTFKCNDEKLQKYLYLNLNKKIMGDSEDNKTVLLSSTKKVCIRSVDLYGYYILFDEDTQLYTCKMDYFIENFYG